MLIAGAESDNVLLNFISKLSASFSTYNLIDLLAAVGVYFLIAYVFSKKRSFNICGAILASLLSFLYIWTFSYKDSGSTIILFGNSYQLFLTTIIFLGYSSLFYIIFEFLCKQLENTMPTNIDTNGKGNQKLFFISAIGILACWLPWLIMNYPGSIAVDAVAQLDQYFSGNWNAHHPPLSSFIMGTFVNTCSLFANRNLGIFIYLLLQAILGAIVLSYSIYKMNELGIPEKFCALASVFFAITPIFGLYAQWFEKDMLYSIFAFLYVILMVDIIRFKKISNKNAIALLLVGILTCLLRKNGIYVVVPSSILLLILLSKKYRMRMTIITISTAVIYLLIVDGLYPALGIKSGNIREALSIPMQQSARYVRDHGDEVTVEERAALEGFFSQYDDLPETYDPTCSDPIKDIVLVDIYEPTQYFKTWFLMGLKHPSTYFDAFINMNYGYLAPNEQNIEPDLSTTYDEQMTSLGLCRVQNDIPIQIFSKLVYINVVFPVLRYLTMPGFYNWLVIISLALLIKFKRKAGIILLVPEIINILVCLASPLCNGLRYELPVVYCAPLLIAWTWYQVRESKFKKPTPIC